MARKRRGFVSNAVFRQAHADMVQRDGDRWGGLVPPQLVAMVHHAQPQPQHPLTILSRQDKDTGC